MSNQNFEQMLDNQLETIDIDGGKVARINQIKTQISQLEHQISELKHDMQSEMEGMVGNLAVAIRKAVPGLAVNLSNGSCNINHLSNLLSLRPNIDAKMWDVDPNIAGRRFKKYHGHVMGLTDDVGPISDGVSQFFRTRYKRLSTEGVMPAVAPMSDKAGHTSGYK
jgi:HAMP domain-containing protein